MHGIVPDIPSLASELAGDHPPGGVVRIVRSPVRMINDDAAFPHEFLTGIWRSKSLDEQRCKGSDHILGGIADHGKGEVVVFFGENEISVRFRHAVVPTVIGYDLQPVRSVEYLFDQRFTIVAGEIRGVQEGIGSNTLHNGASLLVEVLLS
jgi:hypothetical protein